MATILWQLLYMLCSQQVGCCLIYFMRITLAKKNFVVITDFTSLSRYLLLGHLLPSLHRRLEVRGSTIASLFHLGLAAVPELQRLEDLDP